MGDPGGGVGPCVEAQTSKEGCVGRGCLRGQGAQVPTPSTPPRALPDTPGKTGHPRPSPPASVLSKTLPPWGHSYF